MIHLPVLGKIKKCFALSVAGIVTAVSVSGCSRNEPVSASDIVMDTVFTVTLYGDAASPADLLEYGKTLDEKVLSRYSDSSLISRYMQGSSDVLTYDIAGHSVNLDSYLDRCDEMTESSFGAFDVHIGALCDAWDIEGAAKGESEFAIPSEQQLSEVINDRNITDLGSVGKGIYLDLVKDILNDKGVSGAVISAGGSILVYGIKDDGSSFKVGIKDPFGTSDGPFGVIELNACHFVSTSGSYERYTEAGGVRYHHILDPYTGYPAWTPEDIKHRQTIPEWALSSPYPYKDYYPVSVTVIADEGFLSDALSTACFVLEPEMGMRYAESFGAEVIYIMNDGTYITSDGIIAADEDRLIFRLK